MAFLCPVRIPRRKRKKKDGKNSTKNGAPKGRITVSNSIDSLVGISKKEDDSDNDFEPKKMVILHDFIPCVVDEVAVKRGEHVKALYQETDWIYIVKGGAGQEGFIPFTYCVSEDEYDKRKEKLKNASLQPKNSPHNVTLQDLPPAEFSKLSYGEFVVKFDFDAIDEDDISVRKGEIVQVLNKDDQDWYWVKRKGGREGFIPKDFVTKIEQITSSKTLANSGLQSRSTQNMASDNYNTVLLSSNRLYPAQSKEDRLTYFENNNNIPLPAKTLSSKHNNPQTASIPLLSHTPIIYAHPLSSVSGLNSTLQKSSSNAKVMPLSSTMSYSPMTISTQSSPAHTPVLPANSFSSISEIGSTLPNPASFSKVAPMSSTLIRTHPTDSSVHRDSTKVISSHSFLPISGVEKIGSHNARGRISLLAQMNSQQASQLANNATSKVVNYRKEHGTSFSPAQDKSEARRLPDSLSRTHPSRKNSNDLLINGQELVCTDTYIAQKRDELTLYKGDWIYADMKSRDARGWIWAFSPSTNNQGFVPKYCLRPPATTPL